MIGAVEDVEEPELDELPCGLPPARVEPDESGIAVELEGAHRAAWRQKAHHGQRADAQPREPRRDREVRALRLDRILEQHVEQPLAPDKLGVRRERRRGDVRQRLLVRRERAVRRQRGADGGERRLAERDVVLVGVHEVAHPERRGVAQRAVGAAQVHQVGARRAARLRVVHVPHGLQGHADEQPQPLPLRLQEHLGRHVVRDVVGANGGARAQQQNGDDAGDFPIPGPQSPIPWLLPSSILAPVEPAPSHKWGAREGDV